MPTIRLDIAFYWVVITLLLMGLWMNAITKRQLEYELKVSNETRPATTIVIDEDTVPKLKSK